MQLTGPLFLYLFLPLSLLLLPFCPARYRKAALSLLSVLWYVLANIGSPLGLLQVAAVILLITLLAIWVGPFLPEAVILEMSGVGGLLIVGLSINMLGLMGENRVRVGNMLPAVFLPIAYVPFVDWLSGVIG